MWFIFFYEFSSKKSNFALQSFQTPAHNGPSSRLLSSRFPPPLPPIPHPLPPIPHSLSPYPRPPLPTHTASSQFLSSIFESLAFTSFHALLRIGELIGKSSAIPILKAQDITFKFMDSAVPYALVLWISEYKHSKGRDISWNVLKCSNYTLKLWIMAPRKFLRYLCLGSVDKCTLTVNKLLLCFSPLRHMRVIPMCTIRAWDNAEMN